MANLILENTFLKATINTVGAELSSLIEKSTGLEHIWQADPAVWKRHAPNLFPIVGMLENNEYKIEDKVYQLNQHGFARDKEFKVELETSDTIVLLLESDDDTLKNYPYQFRLCITFTLNLDAIEVGYKVANIDAQKIYFSLGGHPAFVCPFDLNEAFSDYILEFEKPETATRLLFADGLLNGEKKENFLNDEKELAISHELFKDDAVILQGLQSEYVDLKSTKSGRKLRFNFKGFPLLAFWTKPGKNAPFLCIEPWFGVADTKGEQKDFRQKEYIQILEEGQSFSCVFSVKIIN